MTVHSRWRPIDQAGTAQQRREIIHLAVVIENFVVKLGQKFREAHVFLARDLFQRVPKRHFEPDRRAMAADPKRSGLRFIVALRLVGEQAGTSRYPPVCCFITFLNDIPGRPEPQSNIEGLSCHSAVIRFPNDGSGVSRKCSGSRFSGMHLPPCAHTMRQTEID